MLPPRRASWVPRAAHHYDDSVGAVIQHHQRMRMNNALIAQAAARADVIVEKLSPTLLLGTTLLDLGPETDQGVIVQAAALPWFEILRAIEENPELLSEFVTSPRKFEEFIAGAYEQAGCEVELTPHSGDRGRDVIAKVPGPVPFRILDQCKAFSPGHVVTANDVRALMGVLSETDRNASKGVVTTTSTFAPGVRKEFAEVMPYRIQLRDGAGLVEWLQKIASAEKK